MLIGLNYKILLVPFGRVAPLLCRVLTGLSLCAWQMRLRSPIEQAVLSGCDDSIKKRATYFGHKNKLDYFLLPIK
jgi:hypothetical protein